jgi:hypothetical protein
MSLYALLDKVFPDWGLSFWKVPCEEINESNLLPLTKTEMGMK